MPNNSVTIPLPYSGPARHPLEDQALTDAYLRDLMMYDPARGHAENSLLGRFNRLSAGDSTAAASVPDQLSSIGDWIARMYGSATNPITLDFPSAIDKGLISMGDIIDQATLKAASTVYNVNRGIDDASIGAAQLVNSVAEGASGIASGVPRLPGEDRILENSRIPITTGNVVAAHEVLASGGDTSLYPDQPGGSAARGLPAGLMPPSRKPTDPSLPSNLVSALGAEGDAVPVPRAAAATSAKEPAAAPLPAATKASIEDGTMGDLGYALMAMGLSTAASKNPQLAGALGEGGLAGLQTYISTEDKAKKAKRDEKLLKLEERKVAATEAQGLAALLKAGNENMPTSVKEYEYMVGKMGYDAKTAAKAAGLVDKFDDKTVEIVLRSMADMAAMGFGTLTDKQLKAIMENAQKLRSAAERAGPGRASPVPRATPQSAPGNSGQAVPQGGKVAGSVKIVDGKPVFVPNI